MSRLLIPAKIVRAPRPATRFTSPLWDTTLSRRNQRVSSETLSADNQVAHSKGETTASTLPKMRSIATGPQSRLSRERYE